MSPALPLIAALNSPATESCVPCVPPCVCSAPPCIAPWFFEQRLVLARQDGHPTGLKVIGVVRESILDQLGVRHGDILRALNGEPITTAQAAIDALILVSTGLPLTLVVQRRGDRVELARTDGEQPAWWLVEPIECTHEMYSE